METSARNFHSEERSFLNSRPSRTHSIGRYPEEAARHAIRHLSRKQSSLEDLVVDAWRAQPQEYIALVKDPGRDHSFAHRSVADLEALLATNRDYGLNDAQVVLSRMTFGSNVLAQLPKANWWSLIFENLTAPLTMFLILGMVASFVFHEWTEGGAVLILILLNGVSSAVMSLQAANALEALATLSTPHCSVVRQGEERILNVTEVVVGDLVMVKSGETIPADLRLVTSSDLMANESLLTGESEDVHKEAEMDSCLDDPGAALLFHSTVVTAGSGRGIVIAVGMQSQIGQIAKSLVKEASKGGKKTPLESALEKLGGTIGIFVVVILIIIIVAAILTNYKDPSRPDRGRVITVS